MPSVYMDLWPCWVLLVQHRLPFNPHYVLLHVPPQANCLRTLGCPGGGRSPGGSVPPASLTELCPFLKVIRSRKTLSVFQLSKISLGTNWNLYFLFLQNQPDLAAFTWEEALCIFSHLHFKLLHLSWYHSLPPLTRSVSEWVCVRLLNQNTSFGMSFLTIKKASLRECLINWTLFSLEETVCTL